MTRAILDVGLTNAVLAALLAVLVALLACVCRSRPALVHGLWLLVLLKFVSPPLIPLGFAWPANDAPEPEVQEADTCLWIAHRHEEPPEPGPVALDVAPREEEPVVSAVDSPTVEWPAALVGVWLGGSLLCWSVAGLRLLRLWRTLKELPGASSEMQERIDRLAARMGLRCCPRGWLLPTVLPPMLLVVGRSPRLLLPEALWRSLDETQRDTLILHELAHLRRGDHRIRWLEVLVLGLYWWHPAAWWCSRALRNAEEQCCDAWVVWAEPAAAAAYASTLVEAVAYLSREPARLPAGASGAGPVRLIKRRLTMILDGRTPRRLSRVSMALVLLLGLGLLPVAPTIAQSGSAKSGTTNEGETSNEFALAQKSCVACHLPKQQPKKQAGAMDLHNEVVKLLDERARLQKRLKETESRLRHALNRFDKQQGSTPTDARLEGVEKKLKKLLEEVESLRKEMRKSKTSGSLFEDVTSPAGVRRPGTAVYTNTRLIGIPVKWEDPAGRTTKKVELYVTTDGGKTWKQCAVASRPGRMPFKANEDGVYGFLAVAEDQTGRRSLSGLDGQVPQFTVVIDTVPPKVKLEQERRTLFAQEIRWSISDANLALETLRIEFRHRSSKEWQALAVPKKAEGRYDLHRDCVGGEVRLSVADKAGNSSTVSIRLR